MCSVHSFNHPQVYSTVVYNMQNLKTANPIKLFNYNNRDIRFDRNAETLNYCQLLNVHFRVL